MKASLFHQHGGPEVLQYEDFPEPSITDNDVLVKVKYCSINHLDLWIRGGLRTVDMKLPHICGCDISGTVADKGKLVEDLENDSEVIVSPGVSCGKCNYCLIGMDNFCRKYSIIGGYDRHGGYAEYVSVPKENIILKPNNVTFQDAAAFSLTFLTAWQMLVTKAKIKTGDSVLVIGGGSGVGSAAIQIAKLFNATIISTAGTEQKLTKLKELGVDHVVDHSKEDYGEYVRNLTQRNGVDIVFDHVGKATWDRSIKSLTFGGRYVTCGATSGAESNIDIRMLYRRQISIMGSFMGSKGELLEIMKFVENGSLKPIISDIFKLSDANVAHQRIENSEHFGKVLLEIS